MFNPSQDRHWDGGEGGMKPNQSTQKRNKQLSALRPPPQQQARPEGRFCPAVKFCGQGLNEIFAELVLISSKAGCC